MTKNKYEDDPLQEEIDSNKQLLLEHIKAEVVLPVGYTLDVWYDTIRIGKLVQIRSGGTVLVKGVHITVRTSAVWKRIFYVSGGAKRKGYSYEKMDSAIDRVNKLLVVSE